MVLHDKSRVSLWFNRVSILGGNKYKWYFKMRERENENGGQNRGLRRYIEIIEISSIPLKHEFQLRFIYIYIN